ncbi:hypothetical protein, partial [Nitrosomonas nitrosa]|uniref:hypothetical protein n=1 Tax=Nitrosomonas nitrosa TaxID=52442 RepID=UPI0023F63D27
IEQAQGVVKDNTELQDQIREQLGKANAVRLFATFEQRKNELTWPIRWMFWSSVTATIIVSLVGYWLFLDFKSNPVEYWNILLIKLPIVTPLIFLAVIFYRRYSREKRLQEEYAFKSAVSLSLEAYRELLEKETIKEGEKSELVKFLTTSVDKIFTSPSEALHKYPETNEDVVSLSGLDKLLETILKHLK